MKTKSKRLAALFMAFAMSVGVLQASVFAAEAHDDASAKTVRSVDIDKDGNFTLYMRCDIHANKEGASCQTTATGKIATTVDENGDISADASKSTMPDGVTVTVAAIGTTKATCVAPATIVYTVTVDNNTTYTSDKFETAPATGKHTFAETPKTAAAAASDPNYKLVSDTSTCQAAGDVTFKRVCTVCQKPIDSETVVYKGEGSVTEHQYIKDEKDTTGKTDKVFDQVIEPATCASEGKEYHYIQCKDCGTKFYANDADTYTIPNTTKGAKVYTIDKLLHSYKYTVDWPEAVNDKTATAEQVKDRITITGECTNCKKDDATDHAAPPVTIVKVTLDSTVEPAAVCAPGSKTYTVTYTAQTDNAATPKKETFTETKTIPYTHAENAAEHKWGTPLPDDASKVDATCTKDGHYDLVKICSVCGKKEVTATIKIPATGKHTAGAAKKENVVNASYAKGGSYDLVTRCTDCGEVINTVHKTTAKLTVAKTTLTSVKNVKGKKATVAWKANSKAGGYEVQYSTNKSFKGAKAVKTHSVSKTLSKLTKNKKYYVRVRCYKVSRYIRYNSAWSNVKTVTIKK